MAIQVGDGQVLGLPRFTELDERGAFDVTVAIGVLIAGFVR